MSEPAVTRRRRLAPFLPSLVATLSLPVWVFSTGILFGVLDGLIPVSGFGAAVGRTFGQIISPSSLPTLAFFAGTLVSIWLVAPVLRNLSLPGVILRVAIAAGLSGMAMFPAQLIYTLDVIHQINEQNASSTSGLVQVIPIEDGEAIVRAIVETVQTSVARIPLISLAALGSWAWQRRRTHGET